MLLCDRHDLSRGYITKFMTYVTITSILVLKIGRWERAGRATHVHWYFYLHGCATATYFPMRKFLSAEFFEFIDMAIRHHNHRLELRKIERCMAARWSSQN